MTEMSVDNNAVDFAIVAHSVDVNRPIDETWCKVGDFADAGRFLNVSSKLVSGNGQIGSVRIVGDSILEVMVGSSRYSYTYAQVHGPMAELWYHGCLELSSLGPRSCRLTYIYEFAPLDEITEEAFHKSFNINVLGPLLIIKAAVKHLKAGASIINIGSTAPLMRSESTTVYTATKGALDSVTGVLAKELGPKNIRINSVNPGFTITEGTGTHFQVREHPFEVGCQIFRTCSLNLMNSSKEPVSRLHDSFHFAIVECVS
jgi:hypothetical protein